MKNDYPWILHFFFIVISPLKDLNIICGSIYPL